MKAVWCWLDVPTCPRTNPPAHELIDTIVAITAMIALIVITISRTSLQRAPARRRFCGEPRAESDHSGSYPAALNMLAHSSGVNCGSASRIASQSVGMVRAAALRRIAFSLAKAFSIGLKSGE